MAGGKKAAAAPRKRYVEIEGDPGGNGKSNGQAAPAPPAGPSAEELRGQLDKVRAAQAELKPLAWQDTDKKRKLDKQAREIEPLLEAAELRELPAPPAGSARSELTERVHCVARVRATG